MKTKLKILKAISLFLVSLIFLMLTSSCGSPKIFEGQLNAYADIDESTTVTSTTKSQSKTKSEQKNYEQLVIYITENGDSYLYEYANCEGKSSSIYYTTKVMYEKVVWKKYSIRIDPLVTATYKIGLAYSEELGIHILSECSNSNSSYPFYIRIKLNSNNEGVAEVVENKTIDGKSAIICFDAENYDGQIEIKQISLFGDDKIDDDFDVRSEYIVNGVLSYADEFIKAEIQNASLKTIGIGIAN